MLRNRAASSPQAAAKIEPVLARTAEAEARIVKVEGEAPPVIEAWSPLAPSIRRVQALCDAAGARLFVAVLPMDVQISDEEWKKYGAKRLDLAPARVLVDDVLASADAVGATPIDLTQALRAAEPGAFVDRDPHLSPKGQAAVATALAAGLEQKPVPKLPAPPRGMPIGRKPPTSLHDARSRHEVTVPGSTAAGCETYIVDEWLTLRCHDQGADKAAPLGVHVVTSPLSESTVYRDSKAPERAVVIQVPVLKGEPTVVDIRWPSRSRRLDATWKDGVVTVAFHPLPADAPAVADLAPPREAICACQKEVSGRPGCGDGPVSDNPACFRSYAGDCASILRCLGGDHGTPPECPRGTGPVGVFQRCSPLCSVEVACTEGKCTPYGGAQVCL